MYCFYYTSYFLSMPPEKAIFGHKISPIDSFSLDRAFNEIPATSLSTPSLSQIMEYYVMFSLDRTSCFYSVICSAFSIPMDRTSFFIFYGINILISLECTSFFDFSFGMFLCHWTVPRFIFYYGALSFILIIFFLIVSSM